MYPGIVNRRFTLTLISVSWSAALGLFSAGCGTRQRSTDTRAPGGRAAVAALGPDRRTVRDRADPKLEPKQATEPGPFRFVDILAGSGVDFVHVSGMTGAQAVPNRQRLGRSGLRLRQRRQDGPLFRHGQHSALGPGAGSAQPAVQEPGRRPVPRRDRASRAWVSAAIATASSWVTSTTTAIRTSSSATTAVTPSFSTTATARSATSADRPV